MNAIEDSDEHHHHHHVTSIEFSPEQIEDSDIQIQTAKEGDLFIKTCVPAKIIVNPNRYAHVVTKTEAFVLDAKKNLGDTVQPGDIIAVLESREMAETKAAYLRALKQEQLASSTLTRERDLKDKKVSATQDYFNAQSTSDQEKINLDLMKQKLKSLGLEEEEIKQLSSDHSSNLATYFMRAPIEGTIVERHLTNGEFIETNQKAYDIANLSNVWIEMGIYPKDLAQVKEGQHIEILNMTSNKYETPASATIFYLSPIIDKETHSAKALAELDNMSGNWRPGTFICANIITSVSNAPLIISKEAIQNIEGNNYVFVRTDNGFAMRSVELGQTDDNNIAILSGLNKGESYATTNTFVLKAELLKGEGGGHEH
jgi:cobalt-zinc-cadmium efflux system membrane fusion protein